MLTRKESLQTKVLRSLANQPDVINSIDDTITFKGKNELSDYIKKTLKQRHRYLNREDIYYGLPENLTKDAIIRIIIDQGFSNNNIIDILESKYNEQILNPDQLRITLNNPDDIFSVLDFLFVNPRSINSDNQTLLLNLLSKQALSEIYNKVAQSDIERQRIKGDKFDIGGGTKRRKRRKRRKHKN